MVLVSFALLVQAVAGIVTARDYTIDAHEAESENLKGLILREDKQKNISHYQLMIPGTTNVLLWERTITNPIVKGPNHFSSQWCQAVAGEKNELGTLVLLSTGWHTVTILQFDKNNKPLNIWEDMRNYGWSNDGRSGSGYTFATQPPDKIIISEAGRPIFTTVVKDGKIIIPEGQDTGGSGGGGGRFIGSGINTPAIEFSTNSTGASPQQTNAGGLKRPQ